MKIVILLALLLAGPGATGDGPEYNADGQMLRPKDYRTWVFLSSGVGMTYGPAAAAARPGAPLFDNVFVSPSAYQSFLQTGKWPDKTVLVLEVRKSESKGSINQGGHFQGEIEAVEVEVKDESRFPTKWAFFNFGKNDVDAASPIGPTARCYACHPQSGAVEQTFVQFYPTLLEVAKKKGTLKPTIKTE